MSAAPPSKPAAGWLPNLDGLNLPRALTSSIQQAFLLIYSLRDALTESKQSAGAQSQYGKHAERGGNNASSVPDGALYFETDRQNAFYQARSTTGPREWYYASGIYVDQRGLRPNDLKTPNDEGFLFLSIDTQEIFRWWKGNWETI